MRPALHVVRVKYSNRFHPSVEPIHHRTERHFPTIQINSSRICSTFPSSHRGIRQDKFCSASTFTDRKRKLKLRAGCLMGYGNKIFSLVSRYDVTRSPGVNFIITLILSVSSLTRQKQRKCFGFVLKQHLTKLLFG